MPEIAELLGTNDTGEQTQRIQALLQPETVIVIRAHPLAGLRTIVAGGALPLDNLVLILQEAQNELHRQAMAALLQKESEMSTQK